MGVVEGIKAHGARGGNVDGSRVYLPLVFQGRRSRSGWQGMNRLETVVER